MRLNRKTLLNSIFATSLSLSFLFALNSAAAQPATLEGAVVKIPVVTVGESTYTVDLTLVAGSEPATFDLTAAAEVPGADTTDASTFEGITLTIPAIQVGDTNFLVRLVLSSEDPVQFQLSDFSVNEGTQTVDAQSLFNTNISTQIIDSRCVTCHAVGGIADTTGLIFERNSDTSAANNFQVFDSFTMSRSDALDYILSKASGGNSHGGGVQLAVGSSDYNNLQGFLDALINGGGTTTTTSEISFFTGVEELGASDTLRRAAIILAGRAPSDVEKSNVAGGDPAALRSAVRALMVGDNFHEFLIEGANDRLLVRGTNDNTFLDGGGIFPNFTNTWTNLSLQAIEELGSPNNYSTGRFVDGVDQGLRDSPLELIAYVVENERPYSEILTADYMMTNSIAAFAMDATGSFPEPENYNDFQPVTLDKYYAWSESFESVRDDASQLDTIVNPGNRFYDYPHAGVLNTQAYLFRYPTTATNRNRARARWTFFHFLDTDIEASAPRTTDPVALADTNNPTMFNSNCTVCHSTMDPLAGAFQNYADEGHFKVNGFDSLDNFYKYPDDGDTPYREGDTWYRDMRAAGLLGETAPSSDNSLQWAAQKIVSDSRFATAAVKFWWPSIIGSPVLTQPQVQSDANYEARLMAYDAQSATIQSLAEGFRNNGMNLKDLLVDMVMSPWFRVGGVDDQSLSPVQVDSHGLANLSSERLLTPEQLARKTKSLTGFTWSNNFNNSRDRKESGLSYEYPLYYGGIDSAGVTKRSRDMTALMSTVALTHASESACPIVVREFALTDGTRALFNDFDVNITPLTESTESFILDTSSSSQFVRSTASANLNTSAKELKISLDNGYCDWDEASQQCLSNSRLEVRSLEIQSPNGARQTIRPTEQNSSISEDCAWYHGEGVGLCNASSISIPFTPSQSGVHNLTAEVWAVLEGADNPLTSSVTISIGADAVTSPSQSTAVGAVQIKEQLVELHQKLHGKTYTISSPEIELAFQLYADTWDEIRNLPDASNQYSNVMWAPDLTCNIWQDYEIGVGMDVDFAPFTTFTNDWGNGPYPYIGISDEMVDFLQQTGTDGKYTKRSWVTVMSYMLSHFDYLYE